MALNTSKCNCLTPLHFKGLKMSWQSVVLHLELVEKRANRPLAVAIEST